MDEKIAPDLMRVTRHVARASVQLECERVRLLQARIEGTYGGGYHPTAEELAELAQLGHVHLPGLTRGTSTEDSAGSPEGHAAPPGWRVPLADTKQVLRSSPLRGHRALIQMKHDTYLQINTVFVGYSAGIL